MVRIRPAVSDEAAALSGLALRSKGYWGYDADFLEACRAELTISPDQLASDRIYLLEEGDRIVGFYGLRDLGVAADLSYFFVEPAAIGRGYGKRLWRHAVDTARQLGFRDLRIEADPNAEPFYRAMGAEQIGAIPSPVQAGRLLPLLRYSLAPAGDPA
jgi:GNAT superfamily N-acetyltransferase